MQAVAFGGYLVVGPPASIPGMHDPVPPWDKLMLRNHSWAFEADDIRHNYYGHPLAGTLYYLVARGNRLSVLESSLWTTASALTWELAEYREPVSVSDLVTTTLGGVAIGEALTQLSAHLERSGGGAGEVLAWLAFPKKVHDLVDGGRVQRMEDPGRHELRVFLGAGPLRQAAGSRPALRSSLASKLFRLADYGAPGSGTSSLADAERSRIQLSMTYGAGELVDLRFRTQTSLWGLYRRDIRATDGRLRGGDLFVGAVIGFDYQYHDARLPALARADRPAQADEMILFEAPGAELQYRTFAGPLALETQASAALTFGGVRPLALDRARLPAEVALPRVVSTQGYYHSAGVALALDLRLGVGPASLGAGVAYNGCRAIQDLDGVSGSGQRVEISDTRLETGARASYRFDGVEVVARWERRVRSGEVGGIARETADTLGLLGLALVR